MKLSQNDIELIMSIIDGTRIKNYSIRRKQYCAFLRNCWKHVTIYFSILLNSMNDLEEIKDSLILAKVSFTISEFCCYGLFELEINNIMVKLIQAEGIK